MYLQSIPLLKYPRTPHLEGSRLQEGDTASDQAPLSVLNRRHVVIEEKIDAANSGLSFNGAGDLLLQSRGHYLAGGANERQFNLFKVWAAAHEPALLDRLEDRYVMYGEWSYKKHAIFYDNLPHLFHEFDIYDRATGRFLSTPRRHALLAGLPVLSVPVLYAGPGPVADAQLRKLVRHSLAKTHRWKAEFEKAVADEDLPLTMTWNQTDVSNMSEGLYIKVEDENEVLARFKFVRQEIGRAHV